MDEGQTLKLLTPECGRWALRLVLVSFLAQISGCGTIFWPERKGQPPGRLDPKVVALDAVGLLLFFVPGVIAFAVDFNNGTIYLPPESRSMGELSRREWTPVSAPTKSPTSAEIELIVQQRTGKSVRLKPGQYRAKKLESAQDLDAHATELELQTAFETTDVRFRD